MQEQQGYGTHHSQGKVGGSWVICESKCLNLSLGLQCEHGPKPTVCCGETGDSEMLMNVELPW